MEFIPFDFEREAPNGEKYLALLPGHMVLKQRRLELNMTQQQVADEAGILLRQYHRLEKGERSITGTSARIFLAVCAVLKLEPYGFFPEIKQKDTIEEDDSNKFSKPTVIEQKVRKSKYIPFVRSYCGKVKVLNADILVYQQVSCMRFAIQHPFHKLSAKRCETPVRSEIVPASSLPPAFIRRSTMRMA